MIAATNELSITTVITRRGIDAGKQATAAKYSE
jgi:hypothetical protein